MALTKAKKQNVIDEICSLLNESKMTVVAAYQGTSVKQLQELRRNSKENGTVIKVVKNRLVIQALNASDTYKKADTSALSSMLLYAFNPDDEVAPAQSLDTFAKKNPSIKFVGGFSSDGNFMSAEEVTALAKLPSKTQMIAGIINTLNSPINNVMGGLRGNLGGLIKALEEKAA